jgi:hypothetical protein
MSSSFQRRRGHPPNAAVLSGALFGLGVAFSVVQLIRFAPAPDQLIGFAKQNGFDPRQDGLRLLILFLFPLLGAGIARLVAERIEASRLPFLSRFRNPSAWWGFSASLFVAAGLGSLRATLFAGILGFLAAGFLLPVLKDTAGENRIGLATAVAHAILAWMFLAGPAANHGLSPATLAFLLFCFSAAVGHWLGGKSLERGAPYLALASLVFPVAFWGRRPEGACLATGIVALLLPLAGAARPLRAERSATVLRKVAVFVFLPGVFSALAAAACFRLPPIGNIFEDGHGLLPASEYMRGELPYRDIVPGHGLISDGLLQEIQLRIFGDDYRGIARGSKAVGAFFFPLIYAMGFAATGSATVGFWGLFLSFLFFPQFWFFRAMASFGVLALCTRAARKKSQGAWLAAGVALPVALLASVDFAFYSGVATVAALFVSRGNRKVSARSLLVGAALSAIVFALLFGALGFLGPFLHTTVVFLPTLLPVYAQGVGPLPSALAQGAQVPDVLASLVEREAFYYVVLGFAFMAGASLLVRAPRVGSRGRALFPFVIWFGVGTLSVIERQHVGYPSFVLPVVVLMAARWIRGWRPWNSLRGALSAGIILLAVVVCRPVALLASVLDALSRVRLPERAVVFQEPPRARGAIFPDLHAATISATAEFLRSGFLGTHETWLDFANAPLLYYLFERDCPIRYCEVLFYEAVAAQQEVIQALEKNRRVKAVLMHTPILAEDIDGIPNSVRAPLVEAYIERHFHPVFFRNGVEYWLRNEEAR